MSASQLQIVLFLFCSVMVLFAILATALLIKQYLENLRLMKIQQQNYKLISELTEQVQRVQHTLKSQPANLNDSVEYLRAAADDIRWQSSNKDVIISDQLEILSRRCKALISMQMTKHAEQTKPLTESGADRFLAEPAGVREEPADRLRRPLAARDMQRRTFARPRPVSRNKETTESFGASGTDVVTLADHLVGGR